MDYINAHKAMVDMVNDGSRVPKTKCMISLENAQRACTLAEINLAKDLNTMPIEKAIELIEKIAHQTPDWICGQ